MTHLAEAHIVAQQRLRELTATGVQRAWQQLPGYDEANVDQFLSQVVPLVLAAQRQSVLLTEAFLARELGRLPLGIAFSSLIGAALRAGAAPEEVYRRPFVTVWTALRDDRPRTEAVAAGADRAVSTAVTDVQLAMRATLRDVGDADRHILGYQRVPDGDACAFCRLVAGQRYTTDQLMPIHNRCGCGVDVITERNRGDFTGNTDNDLDVTRDGLTAAVKQHGELGPVLVNGAHHFTAL